MSVVSIKGRYCDGNRPVADPATLVVSGQMGTLTSGEQVREYSLNNLRVSPRIGDAAQFVSLPDGGQFLSDDHHALALLPQESFSEGLVAWLERRTIVAVLGVFMLIAALLWGYLYGLPMAANKIAKTLPIESEQLLGQTLLQTIDKSELFSPSQADEDMQDFIRDDFAELITGLPYEPYYRLEFRKSPLGPNAFALPGGIIILSDSMLTEAGSLEEIASVLAHEIGHVEKRHSLRHLLQDSGIAIIVTALTGDAASLTVAVTAVPALLLRLQNSREFETEADDFAFQRLKQTGRSPESFAALMERLFRSDAEDGDRRGGGFGFLSTHPITAERIQRAREAAKTE